MLYKLYSLRDRYLNPHKKEYTWQKDEVALKINYIWIGEELREFLSKASIKDIDLVTGSNYKMAYAELELSKILRYGKLSRRNQKKLTRRVFLYHKASPEDWEVCSICVEHLLFTKYQNRNAKTLYNTHRSKDKKSGTNQIPDFKLITT